MKPQLNQQQADWLAQAEDLNNTEAQQVNGGISEAEQFAQQQAEFQANVQKFKMYNESLNTAIKSIGERLYPTSRKS